MVTFLSKHLDVKQKAVKQSIFAVQINDACYDSETGGVSGVKKASRFYDTADQYIQTALMIIIEGLDDNVPQSVPSANTWKHLFR